MKNKKILIIVIITVILAAGVVTLALLNAGDTKAKDSQDNATVTVKLGDTTKTFDPKYLKSFDKIEFGATMDTSKSGPEQTSFGGVPLVTVLESLGFKLDNAKKVTFKAADGYASVVTAEEAADPENVYLVYERGGKPSGTKQQGGSGPVEVVIRMDLFSQRWCKFLMEIDIE